MPKTYKRNCDYCGNYYKGVGKYFCGYYCCKHSERWRGKMSKTHKGKPKSENHKQSIREASFGKKMPPRSEEWSKKQRKSHLGKKRTEETKKKQREWHINNPNRIFKDTKIELKMEEELKRRNINYEKQIPLCKIAIVDFYLPEHKIIIQCDGDYWHNLSEHKSKDKNQDKVLQENGFNVYRFWEHEINENVKMCVNKIKEIKYEYIK